MIKANFNTYNTYVTDSLYQWDINQDLVINGLNLSVAPEIHFSNANMDRAIVSQSTIKNGVITARIPNSLLQEPLNIKAYVGIYDGETFKVIEAIEIPIRARARPYDYQISDSDEEIYSFKSLENMISNFNRANAITISHSAIDNVIHEGLVYYVSSSELGLDSYATAPISEGVIITTCDRYSVSLDGDVYHQTAIDTITGAIFTRTLFFKDYEIPPFNVAWTGASAGGNKFKTIGYEASADYVVKSPEQALTVFETAINEADDGDTLLITSGDYGQNSETLRIKKIGLSLVGVGNVNLKFAVNAANEATVDDSGAVGGDTTNYLLYLNNLNLYKVTGEGNVGSSEGCYSSVYMSRCNVADWATFTGRADQCHFGNYCVQGYYGAHAELHDCKIDSTSELMMTSYYGCDIYCKADVQTGGYANAFNCRIYGGANVTPNLYALDAIDCVFIGFNSVSLNYSMNCTHIKGTAL